MSATGRGGIRLDDDAYETPYWTFDQFLPYLKAISPNPSSILEPGAGTGNLVRKLGATYRSSKITAVEIREECRPFLEDAGAEVYVCDFVEFNILPNGRLFDQSDRFDLIFGNPPFGGKKWLRKAQGGGPNPTYGLWLRFVQRGLELLSPGGALVFLLRMAVLESQDRNEWMRMHVPDVYVLPKRPSFTGTGQDSTAYAWMVWRKLDLPRTEGKIVIMPNPVG